MNNNSIFGIDLAKNYFQVCALNQANKVNFNKQLTRNKLAEFMQQQSPRIVAMEACSSSNFGAKKFESMGHTVKLVPAQHVKPFVKGNKNDRNDAVAICEAALRPNMFFACIKSNEQQDIQMLHRIRQLYVKQSTSLGNQIRGYLSEYGVIIQKQLSHLLKELPHIISDEKNKLTPLCKELISLQYQSLIVARKRISELNDRIVVCNRENEYSRRLQTLPGVGPLISSALLCSSWQW